jgi:hypothetical protein
MINKIKIYSKYLVTSLTLVVLLTFLQTSLSFAANKSLSTFKNISPQSTSSSPTQTTPGDQPQLSDKTIGPLPALTFDGTDHYLNYNGTTLANKDYTIFVVEQRTDAKVDNYFFGGVALVEGVPLLNEGLILGYKTNTQLVFSQGSNEEIISIEPYSSGAKPIVHTFVHDSANGKKYYRNGALVFSDNTNITPLLSNNNAQIGRNRTTQHYKGNIAEVAVYKRAISNKEIDSIHGYLLDKWDIKVTTDGTACLGTSTPHSPGYVTIPDGVWPDAANGGNSVISCNVGGVIGIINNMICTNGVWSGGDGGGNCGLLSCTDDDPDASGIYGSAILTNSGTWGGPTGTLAHGNSINATCPGGFATTAPTLTCNNGTFDYNGLLCAPLNCTSDPDTTDTLANGNWGVASATNGQVINGTCASGFVGSPTIQCVDGGYTNLTGSCVAAAICDENSPNFVNLAGHNFFNDVGWQWLNGGAQSIVNSGQYGLINCASGYYPFAATGQIIPGGSGPLCTDGVWNAYQSGLLQDELDNFAPVCRLSSCALPANNVVNGYWLNATTGLAATDPVPTSTNIEMTCYSGTFSGTGPLIVRCQNAGWNGNDPTTTSGTCS